MIANASDVIRSPNTDNSDLIDSRLMLKRVARAPDDNGRIFTCVVVDVFGKKNEAIVSLTVTGKGIFT